MFLSSHRTPSGDYPQRLGTVYWLCTRVHDLVDTGVIVLGGPLGDEHRVAHAIEAESVDAVRATLARDPWSETHLRLATIDPWTTRLDGRGA